MFDHEQIIVGLEAGTAKVCAVVGEVGESGALTILGVGQSESRGVRKGEIVDTALAEEDIRAAIADAEHQADVEIESVFLGVSGKHIQGFNNRGVHTIVTAGREIDEDDVQDVIKNAKVINLPVGHHVVHAVRQHFLLDGQEGILNPVGMLGTRLEVDMHVVHGVLNRLQNTVRIVKGLQVDVDDIAFCGLASSLAVLTGEQKEIGSLVIDIGAGTTEYVVYSGGIVKHTGVLAVGGDHVTNDLAIGLKLPIGRAEQIKLSHGHALAEDGGQQQTVSLLSENGLPERPVNLEHLRRIMSARLEEIFEIIEQELARAGMLDCLRAGVFLCGGSARTPGLVALAERVFQTPAHLARNCSINSMSSTLDQPEFATAIGLVRFGAVCQMPKHRRVMAGSRGGRSWFKFWQR